MKKLTYPQWYITMEKSWGKWQKKSSPVLIPRKEYFTKLLTEDTHRWTHHGETSLTLVQLRQNSWTLQVCAEVKSE